MIMTLHSGASLAQPCSANITASCTNAVGSSLIGAVEDSPSTTPIVVTNYGTISNVTSPTPTGPAFTFNFPSQVDQATLNNYSVIDGTVSVGHDNSTINNYVGGSIVGTIATGFGYIDGITNYPGAPLATRNISNAAGSIIQGTGTLGIGIGNDGSIGTISPGVAGGIDNSGTIQGVVRGISNTGLISVISNNAGGVISAFAGDAIGNGTNSFAGMIGFVGNYGVITAPIGSFGINNSYNGIINVLVNAQSNLTYKGNLPANYGIVLGSNAATYGRLNVTSATAYNWNGTSGSGVTSFGISGGTVNAAKYVGVLSGVTANLLDSSSLRGTYGSNTYQLALEGGSTTVWDLLFLDYFTGPTTADTQQSMGNTSKALQGTVTILNTALVNSLTYDCTEFGANNVCISAGGRNTAVSAANGLNNTSVLLIAAYRPHPNYRIGAYADQNLSVNNAGSTVNLGNNTPLVGLFGAWTERLDGTGAEVRASAAYGQKNAAVTRQVVGTSEAGNGSAPINSQGAQVTAKYGFGLADAVIVSPYVGVRYTQNNMNGYSEQATSSVTTPLTYSALNTNATTVLAGVGASYKFIPQATVFASAGVETDTNTNNGTYSATGVSGLMPINFNINPVKTRPTATLGAYYDVEKNQRLGVTGIYRQEPYQAVQTTTVMATYTIGL